MGPQMFDANMVEGSIRGTKYKVDGSATMMAHPENNVFPKSINPGSTAQGVALIDIPAGERLDTLYLHDPFLSEGTRFRSGSPRWRRTSPFSSRVRGPVLLLLLQRPPGRTTIKQAAPDA